MKNKFLSILALGLVFTLSSASATSQNSDEEVGRQCCTKTVPVAGGNGSTISITACAGWFLSNDANAMTRACAKVDEAMGIN